MAGARVYQVFDGGSGLFLTPLPFGEELLHFTAVGVGRTGNQERGNSAIHSTGVNCQFAISACPGASPAEVSSSLGIMEPVPGSGLRDWECSGFVI